MRDFISEAKNHPRSVWNAVRFVGRTKLVFTLINQRMTSKIPKSGKSPSDPSSYRLLLLLGKITEKTILARLVDFKDANHFLIGFRKKQSRVREIVSDKLIRGLIRRMYLAYLILSYSKWKVKVRLSLSSSSTCGSPSRINMVPDSFQYQEASPNAAAVIRPLDTPY